jgi:hypothetical protein
MSMPKRLSCRHSAVELRNIASGMINDEESHKIFVVVISISAECLIIFRYYRQFVRYLAKINLYLK